jgi:hypothetical protein
MGDRIQGVTVRPIRLTPTEAELAVKLDVSAPAADAEVHGRLMGPRCKYSSTVEVAYPIRQLPRSTFGPATAIGRVIIPEPSWWDPESPFLYGGPVELWEAGQTVERTQTRCGLHHATVTGNRLIWNGRSIDVRVATEAAATPAGLTALRQANVNLVFVDADTLDGLVEAADEIGILLAGRAVDAAARAATHSPLRHPSLLGFLDDAGSLVLTGGRGVLQFDLPAN